jgi:hypothetical protein
MNTNTVCTPDTHRWVPVTRDFDVCTECRQSRTAVSAACKYPECTLGIHTGPHNGQYAQQTAKHEEDHASLCGCGHPLGLHGSKNVGRTLCLDPDHPECDCQEARNSILAQPGDYDTD